MTIILYYPKEDKLKPTDPTEALDKIYYQQARVPTQQQIKDNNIKTELSKIDIKIPLYDEQTRNIYLINKDNVYDRVVYQSYRLPDAYLLDVLKTRLKEQPKNTREKRKLELMLDFMDQLDLDALQTTYIKIFYHYANQVGKNITVCLRPSFLPEFPHINPYYSRSELINMALNLEIIKPNPTYYENEKLQALCNEVKKNDVNAAILQQHRNYIINNKKLGIVQYYSLQGSFFMNQYLRGFAPYKYKNALLEENINSMWELINNAPPFDKSYIVFRFIKDDSYLKHLQIGDIYTDPSFISTTRDPFYRSDVYKFGFILIKIKLPKNKTGVALCVEAVSQFPEEEEIILPPLSQLRLDKKDDKVPYYHTDDLYETNIKTRYEFTYVGHKAIALPTTRPVYGTPSPPIDFLKITKVDAITTTERIKQFIKSHVNELYQYNAKIGTQTYTIIVESYDSTSVYSKFYAAKTDNGFLMYTLINSYIGFTIELVEDAMYVNYYFRYSSVPPNGKIPDKDLLDFISKVAYYFEIKNIILFCEYSSCTTETGGNYCVDFYTYLKTNTRKLKFDTTELKPQFSYYELDRLKTTSPLGILMKEDRDELYQIFIRTYTPERKTEQISLADFYVWLIDNYCNYTQKLIEKMPRLYNYNNPFDDNYYKLNSASYLYNNNYIDDLPTYSGESASTFSKGDAINVPRNEYRLSKREL
jgi:nitrogen regulatory protein PII-like uncharacterized protein